MTRPSDPKFGSVVVVGLRGCIGAGKTTIATAMREKFRNVFVRSMAGPLKQGLAAMGVTKTECLPVYREWAQRLGEGLRQQDSEWWVKQARKEVQRLAGITDEILKERPRPAPPPCIIVFDDVRYPNEASLCDLLFFIRPGSFVPAAPIGAIEDHESEAWNQAYDIGDPSGNSVNPSTTLIINPNNSPDDAAAAIMQRITVFRTA